MKAFCKLEKIIVISSYYITITTLELLFSYFFWQTIQKKAQILWVLSTLSKQSRWGRGKLSLTLEFQEDQVSSAKLKAWLEERAWHLFLKCH